MFIPLYDPKEVVDDVFTRAPSEHETISPSKDEKQLNTIPTEYSQMVTTIVIFNKLEH